MNEYESIRPYGDGEVIEAMARVARHRMIPIISKYLFPKAMPGYLARKLKDVRGVDDFQNRIMLEVVTSVIARTSEGFTVSGAENLHKVKGSFLAVTNHRDIVLDPALIQFAIKNEGLPCTQLCVGDNLLSTPMIEDLMRSNKMIKVLRGLKPREMYSSSKILSKYIRESITRGEGSVWIAQREGRTKNGLDATEQGLLKMFDLSGAGDFADNFAELNIIPMSISYEYESCDAKKARELLIKKQNGGQYVKKPKEDTHSILTGIRQRKGHIHLTIGEPISRAELEAAAEGKSANERYQALCRIMDRRILSGYKLFKTNYMGYDLMNGSKEYLGVEYLPHDLDEFVAYTEHKLLKLERRLDRMELHRIFWGIYGNPVVSMKKMKEEA